ncbi:uncharacterized protein KNAG_0A03000 [Huiozyma naganishii CBS 8797]|uniref:Oxysterol-binding protein n=1 Tax=Huiozyma naganishii (strain ATCC MYA-139 / BCRC 22969 / CBS 8797 / KCTC 17520 / NBRC 10181 / NCYC 3082 / Yp74L-3) TaxID=1071383 RepID=J7REM3_HUIN7|nr:hypothetical protein KNAG_0A03000 [Kazachstania naganishii CBS 8797]CCK67988.1 hypothetical protein KNAG_0A03000 [Kazachstania naganishii CBS 8797]
MTDYSQSSTWTSFLKSMSSFSGDLSSLSAPPFILSPMSLSEFPQYWGCHQGLFLNIARINKENYHKLYPHAKTVDEARMLAVIKWFFATLHGQYSSRSEKGGFEKKPLNPFLGELFVGKWENEKLGDTTMLTEQVSHHPPINAYCLNNEKQDITLQGYSQIKSSFSKTLRLNVKQFGHSIIETSGGSFLVTVPALHLEGLLVASPHVELEDKSYIQSSSGLICVLEYSGKGYFSGQKNTVKAKVYSSMKSLKENATPLYVISGQWSGVTTIVAGNATGTNASKPTIFSDVSKIKVDPLVVKPVEDQHPLESRKAWYDVAKAIELGDMKLISQTKSKLENAQRQLRKEEKENKTHWKTRWFEKVDYNGAAKKNDPEDGNPIDGTYLSLVGMAGLSIKNVASGTKTGEKEDRLNKTADHWRFRKDLWEKDDEVIV